MTSKKSNRLVVIAALAALSVPAISLQPAAAEGSYGGYRYEAFLAIDLPQDTAKKAAKTAPGETTRQTARVGAADADTAPEATRPRSRHYVFDVAPEEEQHYRD